ncbi:hypothetical protein B0T17DRAFT_395070 [Bombardia bombarda]|uniref:Uncharacterized protein n=1 Tax=Bombardia bombarda TaxID=252184 RepID=A0AA39U6R4_9PEZI|nr:hypothetical protein B0T17DRAFT_395070 [Bombardia bombarda]
MKPFHSHHSVSKLTRATSSNPFSFMSSNVVQVSHPFFFFFFLLSPSLFPPLSQANGGLSVNATQNAMVSRRSWVKPTAAPRDMKIQVRKLLHGYCIRRPSANTCGNRASTLVAGSCWAAKTIKFKLHPRWNFANTHVDFCQEGGTVQPCEPKGSCALCLPQVISFFFSSENFSVFFSSSSFSATSTVSKDFSTLCLKIDRGLLAKGCQIDCSRTFEGDQSTCHDAFPWLNPATCHYFVMPPVYVLRSCDVG